MKVEKIIAAIPDMGPDAKKTLRENAERLLGGTAAEQEAARQVLAALADQEVAATGRLQDLDAPSRLEAAFRLVPPTKTDELVIRALLDNPDSTSSTLGGTIDWGDRSWQMHFGKMCSKREHLLWPAKPYDNGSGFFYCGILAETRGDDRRHWRFTMRPQAVTGFAVIGIKAKRLI